MFKLAWRNLWRNKRRTYITLASVIFAALLVSFARFFSYGSHQETIWSAVQASSGYIQVAAYGWNKNKSLDRALDVNDSFMKSLRVKGVSEVSPRIVGYGLAAKKSSSRFVSVLAADPEKEKHITILNKKLIKGKWLAKESLISECVIGYQLAVFLGIEPGDTLSIVTSQFDGSVGALNLIVRGIYKANDSLLDGSRIVTNLQAGRELFHPDNTETGERRYSSIALGVKNIIDAAEVRERLQKLISPITIDNAALTSIPPEDSDIYKPVILFWPELIPGVVQLMQIDQGGTELTLSFIILIMAFGILNTVQMSIQERTREFGILMALGTRARRLINMIMIEVSLIFIIGLVIGFSLGILVGLYFEVNPIILAGDNASAMVDYGFSPILRCLVSLNELWVAFLTLTLPSFSFIFLAARKVSKIEPVRAIQEGI